jgi:xanthine dehydrogenase small subunit
MVDLHGSQCGFCTPGFVAALYALYRAHIDGGTRPDRAVVDRWLAGNLCRCTGYGPIAAAAVRMLELPRPAWDIARAEQERAALARLAAPDDVVVHTPEGRMSIPAGLRSLTAMAAAAPDATVVAGATDVGLWVTKKLLPLPTRVFTHAVFDDGFRAIHRHGRRVILGAGVTHAEAMAAELHPALTELWRRFAGEQVRNAGTVGGNLANGSPIGDLAPALIALDATLHLRHCDDTRELPLEAFFLAYGRQDRRAGEIVTAVSFDLPAEGAVFDVHKVSKRFDDDISAVCGAFHLPLVDGRVVAPRIAYGGMAAIPKRARHVEAALDGQRFDAASIIAALPAYSRDFQPIDDMRASAAYRLLVAGNLLRRILWEHEGTPVRLVGPRADVAEYAS